MSSREAPAPPDGSAVVDALLADGGLVRIRPVLPSDAGALAALHQSASDRSIYLRYFGSSRRSGRAVRGQAARRGARGPARARR